jgi:hypothetical protein
MMVVPAVGQDRGHEPEADEQHAEGLTHTTSQEEKGQREKIPQDNSANWRDELI